jgi:hypothetical protein
MRAILRTGFGGPEVLVIREIPEPQPKAVPRTGNGQADGRRTAPIRLLEAVAAFRGTGR